MPNSVAIPLVSTTIESADWELEPSRSFRSRWADSKFKDHATAVLSKFVGPKDKLVANPAILCGTGNPCCGPKTDLDARFMELGAVPSAIIRDGELGHGKFRCPGRPPIQNVTRGTDYHGAFFFTAEYLLSGAINVSLSLEVGHGNAWPTSLRRVFEGGDGERRTRRVTISGHVF